MEWLGRVWGFLQDLAWGPVMLVVMLGIGLLFTVGTRFLQVRKFAHMFRVTIGDIFSKKSKRESKNISPFAAMTTALAGTMGVGNIAGVATAIRLGGPGAIFWMWVSALLGMMTKYAEVLLSVKYRVTDKDGQNRGGPMYYIQNGLGWKWLAVLFSLLCVCASFGIGNMSQSNTIAESLSDSFAVPPAVTGVVVCALCGLIVLGGIKRIGKFTELLIPFMSIVYVVASVWVLCVNYTEILPAFGQIFAGAFTGSAVTGGAVGFGVSAAVRYGISRGVFTNEAGLGSAPIAHAAADTKSPVTQGFWGIFEVFADTFVVCTLTTLVILTTGVTGGTSLDGAALTTAAFATVFGDWGGRFIAVSIFFFALASMLGWCFYGERSLEYITNGSKTATTCYRVLFLFFIVVGATVQMQKVWEISDTLNGLMAIPNLIAIALLSRQVFAATRDELGGRKRRR